MKSTIFGLCLLSSVSAFAGISCDELARKDIYFERADKAKSNDKFLEILREGRQKASECNFEDKVAHYSDIIQEFERPAPRRVVYDKKGKQKRPVVECEFRENTNRDLLLLDIKENSAGDIKARGNHLGVQILLEYNNQRSAEGSKLEVSFDGFSFKESQAPGLRPIRYETGSYARSMGAKRELRVECFPQRERLVEEVKFDF